MWHVTQEAQQLRPGSNTPLRPRARLMARLKQVWQKNSRSTFTWPKIMFTYRTRARAC